MIYTLIKKDEGGNVTSTLSFDCITSMSEDWTATVSTQVVEKGFNISDNVNIEPEVYSIDAILSSYSLFMKEREISWDGEKFGTKQQSSGESHIEARAELKQIFKSGSLISLLESNVNSNNKSHEEKYRELKTGYYDEIDNCVITNLSISHPSSGTGAFLVSIKIQKVYTATIAVVELSEEDAIPLLVPMQAKEKSTGSSTSDGSGGQVDGSGAGGAVGAVGAAGANSEDFPVTEEAVEGEDWFEVYNRHKVDMQKTEDHIAAYQKMQKFMIDTNSDCQLEANGTGWDAICTQRGKAFYQIFR